MCAKLLGNYTANGSSTTDEYGTHAVFNRLIQGDVAEGFYVTANGTPNMTVLVQPGSGRVTTGTYPSSYGYLISHDTSAGESVTIATAAASPRIDYVVAYVDKSVAGSTSPTYVNNTNNVVKFASVAGTPAGSPNPPTVSQIQTSIGSSNPYIILAQVAVGAGVSSITNPNITDLRSFISQTNDRAHGVDSHVHTGCVWSALFGLNGGMTAGTVYASFSGVLVKVSLAAISSHTFTASKDTYIAVDYMGNITYNEVSNNTASPSQPSNAIWLAIVVTNGSAITSVNIGQINATAPVVSSRVLTVSDTNGALIYPLPNQRVIGYTSITANQAFTNTSNTQIAGLSTVVNVSASRRLELVAYCPQNTLNAVGDIWITLWDGAVGSGTQLQESHIVISSANYTLTQIAMAFVSPTAGVHTYNVGIRVNANQATVAANSSVPVFLEARLG